MIVCTTKITKPDMAPRYFACDVLEVDMESPPPSCLGLTTLACAANTTQPALNEPFTRLPPGQPTSTVWPLQLDHFVHISAYPGPDGLGFT